MVNPVVDVIVGDRRRRARRHEDHAGDPGLPRVPEGGPHQLGAVARVCRGAATRRASSPTRSAIARRAARARGRAPRRCWASTSRRRWATPWRRGRASSSTSSSACSSRSSRARRRSQRTPEASRTPRTPPTRSPRAARSSATGASLVARFLSAPRLRPRPAPSAARSPSCWPTSRSELPMHRLLQGDVGAGKTVVAVAALLAAVDGGRQGALMVPTEVLAEQHAYAVRAAARGPRARRPDAGSARRGPSSVALLTSRVKGADRRRALEGLARGSSTSSSARTRCSPTTCAFAPSASSSSTSSTASASSSAPRCARRAPSERRGACGPRRARDDRDADPADRGDGRSSATST